MAIVSAFFSDQGVPATGLSPVPIVRIRRVSDNTLVVTDVDMTELGDGFYQYDFTAFDPEEEYTVRAFAPLTEANDQYKFGALDSQGFYPSIDVG